ncbi:hypothetical protein QTP70_022925 [Hemibagrus guttatus]|uniref:Thioredoxin domain-containing protein n=1 Tax=Hemibagrus guttatus TaxID=175788 RepID=A0AAE0PUG8_9TELE|nr:hypothetical protein QTP70_022925 [Hemibagrus guttatus]KAK3525191.1 hypothetical protein QTP86_023250 [Hemibagrus guttatus]
MPHWEETPGKTQDTLERLFLSAGLGTPRGPSRRAGGRMATRLLVRRIWAVSVKDSRRLPSAAASLSSSSSSRSSSLNTSVHRQSFLSPSRPLLSSHRCISFNVQDNDDFTERVINSDLPVLVDFHAHKCCECRLRGCSACVAAYRSDQQLRRWCGPCKILGPRLEKAVAKQKGRVAMAKVDIDDHTDLAIEYGVSAVPTVIAMRGGDIIDKFVGIKDEDQLDSFVSKLIGQ